MSSRSRWVALAVAVAAAASLSAPWPSRAQGGFDTHFEHSRDSDAAVVEYREVIGELAGAVIALTVYGDGRLAVDVPPPLPGAGRYAARLADAELEALLASLVGKGLMELDVSELEAARQRIIDQRRADAAAARRPFTLSLAADAPTTRITLRLSHYKPAGLLGPGVEGVEKTIVWYDLRRDAAAFPRLVPLAALAAAAGELAALRTRPDLVEVGEGALPEIASE